MTDPTLDPNQVAALVVAAKDADQPHHRQARLRTADEQAALDVADMQAAARRHFDLPGVDHAAELYPDDPERAKRHRDTLAMLRGSLANQIARAEERR